MNVINMLVKFEGDQGNIKRAILDQKIKVGKIGLKFPLSLIQVGWSYMFYH